jgi:hypothetical protein
MKRRVISEEARDLAKRHTVFLRKDRVKTEQMANFRFKIWNASNMFRPIRTFPPMHQRAPLSIAQQDIEALKQHYMQAVLNHTEATTHSFQMYKHKMDDIIALHDNETRTLLAKALEININLQNSIAELKEQNTNNANKIAQLEAELATVQNNTNKIAQLEAELATEQMANFRRYMADIQKTTIETSNLSLWDEVDAQQNNALSAESINAFMQLPMFDEALNPMEPTTNVITSSSE